MTPQEAIKLIDTVISEYKADRATHIKLNEAISVIVGLIPEEKTKEKK